MVHRYSGRLQLLRAEIEKTLQDRSEAIAEFDRINQQVPSMIPEPEGSLRIKQARVRMTKATNAHIRVVKRYVDLLTRHSMKFETTKWPIQTTPVKKRASSQKSTEEGI